jgi:hypothetical protein
MSERQSFWQRLFGREGGSLSERQQRILQYIVERMDKGGAPSGGAPGGLLAPQLLRG